MVTTISLLPDEVAAIRRALADEESRLADMADLLKKFGVTAYAVTDQVMMLRDIMDRIGGERDRE